MCLAIPAKILELSTVEPTRATVDVLGVRRQIDTALLEEDPPKPGDWVLIHVGFAMSKISEAEALDQIQTLNMLGEEQAALQEVEGYGVVDVETPRGS